MRRHVVIKNSEVMTVSQLRRNDWIATGTRGGRLLESAETVLTALGSDISLCIEVLDSMYGHEHLVTALTSRSWIDDVKFGRTGREWNAERIAIAENSVEIFSEFWPSMRRRLIEALLVSFVSALENYVMSLLVEFPGVSEDPLSGLTNIEGATDHAWQVADRSYRKTVKAESSTSAAWAKLCNKSSMPDCVKLDVMDWLKDGDAQAIDEMVLLRNSIVHQAGIAGATLAELFGIKAGDQVRVTEPRVAHYRRACGKFLCAINPAL